MGELNDWFFQTDTKKNLLLGKYKKFIHGIEKNFLKGIWLVGCLDHYSIGDLMFKCQEPTEILSLLIIVSKIFLKQNKVLIKQLNTNSRHFYNKMKN